ncbi:MAG: site-2 protease family protein [Candidatus Spechtbacterales bacterium]|nr:site-2 protease family protein [Candidatus Spechtbacterales bacterium]
MEAFLSILTAIGLITLALVPHEAAHAVAAINRGIKIKEAGLGLPWGPRLYFNVPGINFPITITAALVGAYVDTTEEGERMMKALPASEKAVIYGAGIIANLMTALLGYAVYQLVLLDTIELKYVLVSLIMWFAAALMWRFRKWVALVGIPLAGLAIIGYLAYILWPSFSQDFAYAVTHGGASVDGGGTRLLSAIGLVALISKFTAIPHLILWFILISAIFGISNVLPFRWLDGGLIFNNLYKKITGRELPVNFTKFTGVLLISLSVIAVWGDISALFL